MSFKALGLNENLLNALEQAGYTEPTPIQAEAIPPALQGRDVLGIAQTGTGKTAAFTLPMIERLSKGRARARMPRSLVLAPTRELAAQVAENFEKYSANTKLTMALLIGGVAFGEQEKVLNAGADVIIATPGRLLDLFERGKVMPAGVEIMVVDEADRMLDMGFIPDAIVFCNRKRDVDVVARSLQRHGYSAAAIHGDLQQSVRTETLKRFRDGELRLLVASDVAARGLDIPDVSHVLNFDPPHSSDDYVHRIGRTGRAGKTGVALTIATPEDSKRLKPIQDMAGDKLEIWDGGEASKSAGAAPAKPAKPAQAKRAETGKGQSKPPADDSKPAKRDEPKKQAQTSAPQDKGKKKPSRKQNDSAPVGFGDHTPAFIQSA